MLIRLYTDGACSGNPGPGGYGLILSTILNNGQIYEVKKSGGYRLTTNNRMELAAVIYGLSSLNGQGHDVEVISDSKYVCDAFNKHWIENWHKNNFTKNGGLANADMWRTLWNLVNMQNSVKFTWVKGHADNPYNNECDRLAVQAYKQDTLDIDEWYEKKIANNII